MATRHRDATEVPISFRKPLDLGHTSVGQRIDQTVRGTQKRVVRKADELFGRRMLDFVA